MHCSFPTFHWKLPLLLPISVHPPTSLRCLLQNCNKVPSDDLALFGSSRAMLTSNDSWLGVRCYNHLAQTSMENWSHIDFSFLCFVERSSSLAKKKKSVGTPPQRQKCTALHPEKKNNVVWGCSKEIELSQMMLPKNRKGIWSIRLWIIKKKKKQNQKITQITKAFDTFSIHSIRMSISLL